MDTQISINYDSAFGEDDEMSQTDIHNALIAYLIEVLKRLFSGQRVGVFTSISLYGDPLNLGSYRSPDLLVIDGLVSGPEQEIASYTVTAPKPAPRVLMEICSESTWQLDVGADVQQKPAIYARLGVPEYFACDPHIVRIWTGAWLQQGRLVGWRLDRQTRQYVRIVPDGQGRLWSEQLQSWLVMEGQANRELHLYDATGQLRLTGEEAALQLAASERQQRLFEYQQKLAVQEQLKLEQAQLEAERQRNAKLLERLQQLDPDFTEND
jgi:Uma2 family endonuclease